ncbi:hypothetical protein FHG87_005448 [Trinorchestia longiramus]|nr:hypothetical protein FHG87_005448 [Trinorchestia longiramus]
MVVVLVQCPGSHIYFSSFYHTKELSSASPRFLPQTISGFFSVSTVEDSSEAISSLLKFESLTLIEIFQMRIHRPGF